MDMFDGVGRRLDQKTGQLVEIGANSLNGRELNVLFRNDGDGRFTDVGWVNGAGRIEDGRGLSVFDADRDGRLDLLLRNYRMPAVLLRNEAADGHWLQVRLVGTRSNRDAVGARLRLRTGERWQTRLVTAGSGYLSSSSLIQHFGLGDAEHVDELSIEWPSGLVSRHENLAADRRVTIEEPDGPAGG